MSRGLILAVLAGMTLAGCAMFGVATTKPPAPDTTRVVFAPIIPSVDDVLTDETAQQILLHNCVGYRLGYWDAPGMKEACTF